MLPAHEEILSIQLVTNNKYARQVRSCAAGLSLHIKSCKFCLPPSLGQISWKISFNIGQTIVRPTIFPLPYTYVYPTYRKGRKQSSSIISGAKLVHFGHATQVVINLD